jgi:ABC-type uncharacterized transport system ATPase subunit
VLTPAEVEDLLAVLRRLTQDGKSIVFISHKLGEVLAISDRISVLRDGKMIDTVPAASTNKRDLACMMVGREVLLEVDRGIANPGEPMLSIEYLSAQNDRGLPALKDVSLELCAGEILGIAGVAGNGQSELEEIIAGLRRPTAGSVWLGGRDVTHASPRQIGECGLAYIPSDRYGRGLLPDFAVAENLILQRIDEQPFTRRGWLRQKFIRREAQMLVRTFDVRTPSVESAAGKLSGGNAQKLILARELARHPRVLLAAQPTRGLDVSAIEFVHRTLVQERDNGLAILLFSTELDEIMALSDRIAVMYDGQIIATVGAQTADVHDIGLMMGGSIPE